MTVNAQEIQLVRPSLPLNLDKNQKKRMLVTARMILKYINIPSTDAENTLRSVQENLVFASEFERQLWEPLIEGYFQGSYLSSKEKLYNHISLIISDLQKD